MPSVLRALTALLCGAALLGGESLLAQQGSAAAAQDATAARSPERARLMAQADSLQARIASGGIKGSRLSKAQADLAKVQRRLERGDFDVGDRFVLTIQHDQFLTDTASVREGLVIAIRGLPDASVAGVLRPELSEAIATHVARYLKGSVVRVNVLTRVGVFGGVRGPGYHYISPDRPFTDLIMQAGGFGETSSGKVVVERAGKELIGHKDVRKAMEQGTTIEQLGIQSGDVVSVPVRRRGINWFMVLRVAGLAVGLFFSLISLLQFYYSRQE
jgi:protein involved in polysaccharide export with SLBB domain